MRERGYRSRIHCKGTSRRKLNQQEQATNHRRSKVRARVEHVFGDQRTRQGSILMRTKGKVRASGKDRADEPDLQHATAGVFAQAAIRLQYGLTDREPAQRGGKWRTPRENGVAEPGKDQLARQNDTAAALITPMAPSEPIYRGALKTGVSWLLLGRAYRGHALRGAINRVLG